MTLTLTATPTTVAYGGKVVLSGQVSTKKANQQVVIEGTACGSTNTVKAATVKTVANGVYSVSVTPAIGTTYRGNFKNGTSQPVAVTVKPVLELKRVARGSFTANVTAGQALTGKYVLFQRYKKLRRRWAQVKRIALKTALAGTKPTVVSSVSFKSKLPAGTRVRVMISKAQAGPCYLQAASKSLRA
ncbi:MAG TPA: hypothetical protein VLD13_03950 [Gaiellaceae bacterium]|nr:hypothetical protein [Gaiellaceae bacterium]